MSRTRTATRKGRILEVEILHILETNPDLSHYGEYTDEREAGAIVVETGEFLADVERRENILETLRDKCDDTSAEASPILKKRLERLEKEWEDKNRIPERGRKYRFFLPAMTGEETGNPESPRQDFERMQAYNRNELCMFGFRAQARITLPGSDIVQTIRSGGLWGIESDSAKEYIQEAEGEQLAELRAELAKIGFGTWAIKKAFQNVKTVEK